MKLLINDCWGVFGFSKEFEIHIDSLTKDQLINKYELLARHNQFLVEEAIKFGLDKASGTFSKLIVVDLPDGCEYKIHEYDGMESIEDIWIYVSKEDLINGLSEQQMDVVLKGCSIKLK
jgi:hypothetical protein